MKKLLLISAIVLSYITAYGQNNTGIGTTTPTSTLQVAGSMANALRIITPTSPTSSYTLTNNDYTVISTVGTPITITLPDPTTCPGRIYRILNYLGPRSNDADITFSIGVNTSLYSDSDGANRIGATTSLHLCSVSIVQIADVDAVSIQSDGTNWYVIGK